MEAVEVDITLCEQNKSLQMLLSALCIPLLSPSFFTPHPKLGMVWRGGDGRLWGGHGGALALEFVEDEADGISQALGLWCLHHWATKVT